MFADILQDLRYGARQLRQAPGFSLVAVLSLALGIGANTAIFQLVEAIRLRTLPIRDPHQIATIDFAPNSSRSGWFSSRNARLTYGHWEEIRKQQQGFKDVLAFSATRFNLANGGEVQYADGLYVSGNFFDVLGVVPVAGRLLTPADDTPACAQPGAVVSHSFWQRRFGGSPGVLEQQISLNGHNFPIVGVTAPDFFGVEVGNRFDAALPLCADRLLDEKHEGRMSQTHAWWLSMMGRLKPGWSLEKANAQLQAISPGVMRATLPESYKPHMVKRYLNNKLAATDAASGISGVRRQYERSLWILLAITGLVLLIACANLANLLLARASVREKEIALRLAIGASRVRLVRQLLVESLVLALAGSLLGILLSIVLSRGLIAFLTTERNGLFVGVGVNWMVLGFAAALAVLTCLLFGLAPAVRASGVAPMEAIRTGGHGMTSSREKFSLRRILVCSQVALSLVLLMGALLFVRSLQNLVSADSGFSVEGIMSARLDFAAAGIPKERREAVFHDLRQKLSVIPGVVSASQVLMTPISGSGWNNTIGPDGATAAASGKQSLFNRAGPGYFRTLGTRLIAGRDFTDNDNLSAPKVAIVNQEFARKFLNGANPVGHTFRQEQGAGKPEPVIQIVGMVSNTKYYELREDFQPIAFLPMFQGDDPDSGATFVLRVSGSPSSVQAGITAAALAVNPTASVEFGSFSKQITESLLRERLMASLSGAFGILAGLLAMMGLYGVIAYMVARRRKEIGLRIALGAGRKQVIGLVMRESIILLAAGIAAGALLSLWAGRAAATLLYGLKPYDPVSLAAAAGMLAVIALAASFAPARRAARLQPMIALREE